MGDVSQLTPAVAEPAAGAAAAAAGHAGPRRFFGRLVREQPLGTAGRHRQRPQARRHPAQVTLILVLVSIFADGLAPYRYEEIHLHDRLQAPSAQYLLGTDHVAARPAEPPHPRGAAVADSGAGRHRPHRRGGGADRRHHRLHRRSAGPGACVGRCRVGTQRFVDAWMAFGAPQGLLLLLTIMSIAGRGMLQIIIVLGVSGGIPASREAWWCAAPCWAATIAAPRLSRRTSISRRHGDRQLAPALAAAPRAAGNIAAPIIIIFSASARAVGGPRAPSSSASIMSEAVRLGTSSAHLQHHPDLGRNAIRSAGCIMTPAVRLRLGTPDRGGSSAGWSVSSRWAPPAARLVLVARRWAALSLRGDPPARPSAGPLGPVPAGDHVGRPAEPPHPRGAAVADGGAGRHRPHRWRWASPASSAVGWLSREGCGSTWR